MRVNLSVGQRITLGFTLMVGLALIASSIGLLYTISVERTVDAARRGVEQTEIVDDVQIRWLAVVATIDHMLLTRQTELVIQRLYAEVESFDEQLSVLSAQTFGENPERVALNQETVANLSALGINLTEVVQELTGFAQEGRWSKAQALRHTELISLQRRFNDKLDDLSANIQSDVAASVTESTRLQNTIRTYWGGTALLAIVIGALAGLWTTTSITRPIGALVSTAQEIRKGDLLKRAVVASQDEIGMLAEVFNDMTAQLQQMLTGLEQRVTMRTHDLEQRSAQLAAAAEVSRAVASVLDVDELFEQVVELIKVQFGLYYVGLFLVDRLEEWAELQIGTGEAGRAMLERGHRIKVGEGMVGWSIAHSQARVAHDVGADAVRLATPELPKTRSEAALPLRSRGRVLGALTVQSSQPEAFDHDTLAILQTMADQVAVAIDNARLFAESQTALEAERRAYGEVSRAVWLEMLQGEVSGGYRSDQRGLSTVSGDWQAAMVRAASSGKAVVTADDARTAVAVPIRIREQVVGVLNFSKVETQAIWTKEELALLEALTEQLSLALENARLYQDTQRRAAHEQLTREIADKMRQAGNLDALVQTAMQELAQALNIERVEVHLESLVQ